MITIPYIIMLLVNATRKEEEELFEGLTEGLERMRNILDKMQKETKSKGKLTLTLKSKPNGPKTTGSFHVNVDYLKVMAGGDVNGDFSGLTYENGNVQDNNGIKEGESKEEIVKMKILRHQKILMQSIPLNPQTKDQLKNQEKYKKHRKDRVVPTVH